MSILSSDGKLDPRGRTDWYMSAGHPTFEGLDEKD
jgi:hypothetical protein